MTRSSVLRPRPLARGFTLIDLVVSVAIVGTLATLALPPTVGHLLQARRVDALTAVFQMQHAQERWRQQNPSYAPMAQLAVPAVSPQGHYELQVLQATPLGYTLVAAARGLQQRDRDCRVMRLEVEGGVVRYGSGPDAAAANAEALNRRCWRL
jgi:type IV pilus assembly protein PilE